MTRLNDCLPPKGGKGWYPDPLGSTGERYFNGRDWTTQVRGRSRPAPSLGSLRDDILKSFDGLSPKWGIGIGVGVVVLLMIGALVGNSESSSTTSAAQSTDEAISPQSPQDSDTGPPSQHALALEFKESIAGAISSDESPTILCTGQSHCGVTYEISELAGIDVSEELLNAQREVWAVMFDNPRFREGFIELEAPVESVGGKSSVAPVLRVRCDRRAANQIDWSNVQADGFKQLCQWDELIG